MTQKTKHALVTGAARRIGRTIALVLARAGWDVTIHYRDSATEAETLAQEIRSMGRRATLIRADLEKEEDVEKLVSSLSSVCSIVHNASLFERDGEDPGGARHRRINSEIPIRLTQALFQTLPDGAKGAVAFMLDNTPLPPRLSAYAASKESLRAALPELALRTAPRLRVNAVALGPSLRGARESEAHFKNLVQMTPLARPSLPREVAHAILLLLENEAVTGAILPVDCGAHLLKK